MKADLSGALRRAALLLAPLALTGCEWFTDFKQQPALEPWETTSDTTPYRANPQLSVPTTGTSVPGFAVSYQGLPGTVDSMSAVPNPLAADERSIENGRKYYQINCAVCHGPGGAGDGPATKYGMPGINLLTPVTVSRTDGYLYGMIRNGRGLMPPYNRIEDMDRWDVVNYLRGLQGRLGTQVSTAPAGQPGENGRTVPGPSQMGPTRPAPHTATPAPGQPMPSGAQPMPMTESSTHSTSTHQGEPQ